MVTMIDEIYDRNYQVGRADLSAALIRGMAALACAIGNAFAVLNRIEYAAPWSTSPRNGRSH